MGKAYVLKDFIQDVEGIVAAEKDQWKIVAQVEPLMHKLVTSEDLSWVKDEYRKPPVGKTGVAAGYGQYCLYRRGRELSIIAFCWGPGKGTPVHDHLSWGVLGFIDGSEKETRYRRVDDGSNKEFARLEEIGVFYTRKGQTSHLVTPQRDIHKVENPGDRPSVSIHVYGCDMGTQRRRRYDLETGKIEWYTTPHDSDEIVVD
jgi:predicted metal-dependent enzyme (double-stranded beta helix superfamily)